MIPSSRRSAALGAALAGSLLLAACGGGDSADSSGTGEEGADRTLTVWTYYVAGGQNDALEKQNEMFEAANEGVTIETVQIPFDQLPSKLLATATTQDGPDIILDNVVVDFPTLVSAGVLADLTGYWDGYQDKDLFSDASVWRIDDKVYNVMSYTNLLGLYYNKDALDALGIAPPETMEEFDAALVQVAADGTYQPLAESGAPTVEGAWMFMPQLLGEGIDYCNLSEDALATGMDRIQGWAEAGVTPRETATWDQADAWSSFTSGQYAFGINGNWNLGDAAAADFAVGTARFPAGSQGSRVFPGGEGIGIGAFADDQDLAWQYIQDAWLSSEASLINFEASGQIPTRSDLVDDPAITSNELVEPFVAAAGETAAWPLNEQTAAMQTAIGQSSSAVLSGEKDAATAAAEALAAVEDAKAEGGGSC